MQYRRGTITVTNGSNVVTFDGASAGAEEVEIGDLFKTDRDGDAVYQIASRTPSTGAVLTQVTLNATYGGDSAAGLLYQIVSDFTVSRGYPRLAQGDADAGDWIAKAFDQVDADLSAVLGVGLPSAILAGSVIYKGELGGFAGQTDHLFWDVDNLRLGIGTATPTSTLTVALDADDVDGIAVVGLTGSRPLVKVVDGTHTLQMDSASGVPRVWTDAVTLNFWESGIFRMRLDKGRLLIGTEDMVVSEAMADAGEIILKNAKRYRGLNAAGDAALPLIRVTSQDYIEIAGGGQQILIGTVAIAPSTGAIATLGAVGGAGPQVTAQKAWLPFIDSAGAQRFLPVYE